MTPYLKCNSTTFSRQEPLSAVCVHESWWCKSSSEFYLHCETAQAEAKNSSLTPDFFSLTGSESWWELEHTAPGRLQQRVSTSSTQLPKKLKWENISPISQHVPQYSTVGSRSLLLEEMKSQREIVFAVRESRIRGRETWAKIPNLANKLSMKGRKRKTDLEEMCVWQCVYRLTKGTLPSVMITVRWTLPDSFLLHRRLTKIRFCHFYIPTDISAPWLLLTLILNCSPNNKGENIKKLLL